MAKVRVYELAKELGVESKAILAKLNDLGYFVRSASSPVDRDAEHNLRRAFPRRLQRPAQPGLGEGPTLPPAGESPIRLETSKPARIPEAVSELALDFRLDERFDLLREPVRRGGGSVVRKAIDTKTGSFVAIKFVQHGMDSMTRRLFDREMASLDRLNHPNIVKPIKRGAEEGSGAYFFVLEWYEQSLLDVLANGKVFTWSELLQKVALPLASALSYAHLMQVEHRDIKPGNILLRADGSPVLADFGIAKLRDAPPTDLTVRGFHSGVYTPPDLSDMRSWVRDVYSLGVVFLRCVSTHPIADYSDLRTALDAAPIPPDARALLASCVSLEGADRPANGSVLNEMLLALAARQQQRAEARENYLWIRLTRKAREALEACDDSLPRRSAESILQEDLSAEVYAEFLVDPHTGLPNRERIDLVGTRFRYSLALDGTQTQVVVTFVDEPRIEELERRRNRSLPLGRAFTLACSAPANQQFAIHGRGLLVERLDLFHEARHADRLRQAGRLTEDVLFEQWSKLLDAREELERGEREALSFTLEGQDGRDAHLVLDAEPKEDLVGTHLDILTPDGKRRGTGEVIDQTATRLSIRSGRNFRNLPRQGRLELAIGPTVISLQRQRDAISRVRDGSALRPDLRDLLLDPDAAEPPAPVQVDAWHGDLDEDKQEAVRRALGSQNFLLVQGPPGTGKTSFIAELVWQKLRMQPEARILLVSQTHVAVDNALERLASAGLSKLVRLGRVDDGNIALGTQHLTLDRQMSVWARAMRERAVRHLESYAAERGFDPRLLGAALRLEELAAVLRQTEAIERQFQQQADAAPSELASALGSAQDPIDLQDRIDRNAERQEELLEEIAILLQGDLTVDLKSSADDARAAVSLLVGDGPDARHLLDLMVVQADWLQRVGSQDEMAYAFMKTRRVIAGTNLGFLGHPAARDLQFDLCILDEASKATATETLVPLARSSQWVLVGDTNQLPPMDEEVLRHRHLMDAYELTEGAVRETLFQRLADQLPPTNQLLLGIQYRMIRPIGDMVSTVFYEGRLRSPRSEGIPGYANLGKEVLWLDTSPLGPRRFEDSGGESVPSIVNRAEARLCIDHLKVLNRALESGLIRWDSAPKPHVLVIAPYRLQVEELRRQLARVSLSALTAEVLSVDSVQGRESDFVIFSVTRSNPRASLGFLGAAHWQRINVAMSRARFGLVIVGDVSFCASIPGGLRDVLDYMRAHSDDCEIREVSR